LTVITNPIVSPPLDPRKGGGDCGVYPVNAPADGAWIALGPWLFLLLANVLSNLGVGFTFRRSLVALPFALIAITVLFSMPGKPLASFHFLFWDLTITDTGFLRFISILIRSWLSVQMAILLVAVARFPDLIHALEHLRIPSILTTIIAFLYRYLFVLADEVFRLMRARNPLGGRPRQTVGWECGVARGHCREYGGSALFAELRAQ
jgi:cobalt/nickel transport system permease protein